MKLKICLMGLLCLYFSAKAQTNIGTSPIKIGNKMPDVTLTNVLNYAKKSIRLSDYKGKLILVDFWDTHCGNCIAAIPGLDSLQKKFSNKIQIILVDPLGSERERDVKLFLSREKQWSGITLKLPVVFQDTSISKYVTFQTTPTCAWIGPDGRLVAVTDDDPVTPENIERVMHGESIILQPKPTRTKNSKPKALIK